jgi:hypothetical protein
VYPEVTPNIGYTRQFQEKAIGFPDGSWGAGRDDRAPQRPQSGEHCKGGSVRRDQLTLRPTVRSSRNQAAGKHPDCRRPVTTDDQHNSGGDGLAGQNQDGVRAWRQTTIGSSMPACVPRYVQTVHHGRSAIGMDCIR